MFGNVCFTVKIAKTHNPRSITTSNRGNVTAVIKIINGVWKAVVEKSKDDIPEFLTYPIAPNSYNIKNKEHVYEREKDNSGHWIDHLKDESQLIRSNAVDGTIINENYAPFHPGQKVKGSIVFIDKIKYYLVDHISKRNGRSSDS